MTTLPEAIRAVLADNHFPYITETGEVVRASRLADLKKILVACGWRNVSRLDEIDLKDFGFRIVRAYYGGRARVVKNFCNVVVLS